MPELLNEELNSDLIVEMAEIFKILGDETRIKILSSLLKEDKCVTSISNSVNLSLSAVSHQLRILKQAKLVKQNKKGKEVFYSLDDEHVLLIFKVALKHVSEK